MLVDHNDDDEGRYGNGGSGYEDDMISFVNGVGTRSQLSHSKSGGKSSSSFSSSSSSSSSSLFLCCGEGNWYITFQQLQDFLHTSYCQLHFDDMIRFLMQPM